MSWASTCVLSCVQAQCSMGVRTRERVNSGDLAFSLRALVREREHLTEPAARNLARRKAASHFIECRRVVSRLVSSQPMDPSLPPDRSCRCRNSTSHLRPC